MALLDPDVVRTRVEHLVSGWSALAVPDGWRLTATLHGLPGATADAVWSDPAGAVWLDELATGASATPAGPSLGRSVRRLLEAGERAYGERLGGVRALLLARPGASFIELRDGRRLPLAAAVADAR